MKKVNSNLFLCVTWKSYTVNLCKTATFKRPKNGFQDRLSLSAGQMCCRMLRSEHSAILSTFIDLPVVIKIFFIVFFFERSFYTGFTVSLFSGFRRRKVSHGHKPRRQMFVVVVVWAYDKQNLPF